MVEEDEYIEDKDLEWDFVNHRWYKSDRNHRYFTILKPYTNTRDGDNYGIEDEWYW